MTSRGDVLVVEDDVDIMLTLTRRLNAAGYHTIPAPDGMSALSVADQAHLDAAIVDVNLPGKNGLDVAQVLLADGVKTIVITAARDSGYRQQARWLGCDGFVEKPFTGSYLLAQLDALIGDGVRP